MTERERFNIYEAKILIFNRDEYKCQYPDCNKPSVYLAHRIAQSKSNIKRYGKEIIHNYKNMISVCENQSHNDYFNIGYKPDEVKDLLNEINS